MRIAATLMAGAALLAAPVQAQENGPADLTIVISVDQLSSDLVEEYAPFMTGGLARLFGGTVYLNGYQAQSATETCPGHSTILTGAYPARSGVVANNWTDLSIARADKNIYCAEDPDAAPQDGGDYVVSASHLLVPTLGDLMQAQSPASRNVSVAGKDRAAVMLGGQAPTQRWYWSDGFQTDLDRDVPASVGAINEQVKALIARGSEGLDYPAICNAKSRAIPIAGRDPVGNGRLAFAPGDGRTFRATPAYDGAVLALAAALVREMGLGAGEAADLLAIGLSATDYVGHSFGPGGGEMCLQLHALDRSLGGFFDQLDRWDIDYQVVLTSDHGGLEIPERLNELGVEGAARMSEELNLRQLNTVFSTLTKIEGPVIFGGIPGDVYISQDLDARQRPLAIKAVQEMIGAYPRVAHVFAREEIMAVPIPGGDPANWSMLQRVRASYHPDRSGDLYVILDEQVMPIANPGPTYVSTHGSPYDYDRRVPIVFWREGMTATAPRTSSSTVDIMPTLAAGLGIDLTGLELDGRCLADVAKACPQ